MNVICGKCGNLQTMHYLDHVSPDPEEIHRVWGARCVGCGFSGKSRVSPLVWRQLAEAETRDRRRAFAPRLRWRLRLWRRRARGRVLLGGEPS